MILNLDCSNSLGSQFGEVQNIANSFISNLQADYYSNSGSKYVAKVIVAPKEKGIDVTFGNETKATNGFGQAYFYDLNALEYDYSASYNGVTKSGSVCVEGPTEIALNFVENIHTVTFQDWDETTLEIDFVETGNAANSPTNPEREGYVFLGWSVDFSNITNDLIVVAQFEEKVIGVDSDNDGVLDINDQCPNSSSETSTDEQGCSVVQLLDDDNDGIINALDLCQGSSEGINVNSDGCEIDETLDSDNDGIVDVKDECPNSSSETSTDEQGCSVVQLLDDDNDGIINALDLCENTSIDANVDSKGCEIVDVTDSDEDGVLDVDDLCPNTPADYFTNSDGCYVTQLTDGDKDGVNDLIDRCVNTSNGLVVNSNGCGVDETQNDDDNDGTVNDDDVCPNTEESAFTNTLGCSQVQLDNAELGLESYNKKSFSFYPNPSADFIHSDLEISTLTISNLQGTVVSQFNSSRTKYNVSNLEVGVYLIEAIGKDGFIYTAKLVKD